MSFHSELLPVEDRFRQFFRAARRKIFRLAIGHLAAFQHGKHFALGNSFAQPLADLDDDARKSGHNLGLSIGIDGDAGGDNDFLHERATRGRGDFDPCRGDLRPAELHETLTLFAVAMAMGVFLGRRFPFGMGSRHLLVGVGAH